MPAFKENDIYVVFVPFLTKNTVEVLLCESKYN
jgi:hypothetical protein